jgi:tRNA (guanine37-N1)-methyltransferase
MRFDIITTFPEIFQSYFGASILKRAQEKRLITIRTYNPRDFSKDKRKTVDDSPYGGGAGMVLMAEPILRAARAVLKGRKKRETLVVLLSAKGKQFNQKLAHDWVKRYSNMVMISGRYEGIDERVSEIMHDSDYTIQEVSIGPYVLTDGDVAAMAIVSAMIRLIPGVISLGSLAEESHWNLLLEKESQGIGKKKGLEYPHYTRPAFLKWKGHYYRVPTTLLSGDHQKIEKWRKEHAG